MILEVAHVNYYLKDPTIYRCRGTENSTWKSRTEQLAPGKMKSFQHHWLIQFTQFLIRIAFLQLYILNNFKHKSKEIRAKFDCTFHPAIFHLSFPQPWNTEWMCPPLRPYSMVSAIRAMYEDATSLKLPWIWIVGLADTSKWRWVLKTSGQKVIANVASKNVEKLKPKCNSAWGQKCWSNATGQVHQNAKPKLDHQTHL